ncbi:MAG: tetratricopeptide repeat protein [Paludibacteraceae bacterium]
MAGEPMENSAFKYRLLVILLTLVSLTSCYNRDDRERLTRGEVLLEKGYADSAANTLDSILQPGEMGKEYHMQFLITRVQAKYKAYRDIKRDTAVFEAVDYYTHRNNDPKQIALAYYSAGCVVREQGNKKESIPYFKNALEAASKTNDYTLQGLILENLAYLYHEELFQEQAIEYYKKAYDTYRKEIGTERKQINTLLFLAQNFLTNGQSDSALHYNEIAIMIADSVHDKYYQASLRNNIGITYQMKEDYDRSIFFLKEALRYNPNAELIHKIKLNIARNYMKLNKLNELEKYVPELKQSLITSSDLYYKSAVTVFLKEYEVQTGNYSQALVYSEENNNISSLIFNQNQSRALIEAEKEFDYTQKEMEAEKLKLRQRNTVYISVLVIVMILMLFFVIWYLNLLKQRNKVLQLLAENQRQEAEKKALEKNNQLLEERQQRLQLEKDITDQQIMEQQFLLPLYEQITTRNTLMRKFLYDLTTNTYINNVSSG